jgi:hypothetical protein
MNDRSPEGHALARGPLSRRKFLVVGAAAAATPLLLRMPSTEAAPDGLDAPADFGYPPPDKTGRYLKHITFPVDGKVWWSDSYGACRDGCTRHHEGQDLFGKKGQKLVAAVDGTIVVLRYRSTGNSLYLRGTDGWYYSYLHINNDSPGTDNNHNAYSQAFAPHIVQGARVSRGQHIAYLGDSGNAESTSPHCHFEIRKPASSVWHSQSVNAKYSLAAATKAPSAATHGNSGAVLAPSGSPPLRQGDSGAKVKALQRALDSGTGTHLTQDGSFGPATHGAMRNLQAWFKLPVDGVYGQKSQWALQNACTRAHR